MHVPVEILRRDGRTRWFRLTMDVSAEAVRFAHVIPEELDGPLALAFHLPGDAVPLRVAGIIWCTGYDRDLSWIELEHTIDEQGYPVTHCGISTRHEGLYFMGMAFQYSLASVMINGVGRDARYIVRHICNRRSW